jgi:FkbM family methyltransferase
MPPRSPETLSQRVRRRLGWAVRDRFALRPVQRTVQGVPMVLPWSHRLPDYARMEPEYGQNLPRLAAALASADGRPVLVLDIGANVGDSALQILDAADGRVLCVEGDAGFLPFLHRNTDANDRVVIEPSLLLPQDSEEALAPVRVGGTTRFEPGVSKDTAATISVAELRRRHSDFDGLRLAKSDTDGYDVVLIPSVARAYADSRPVLFFEYDHDLSRKAGNDAVAVWAELADLGYNRVRVWDNAGRPLTTYSVAEAAEAAAILDRPLAERDYHFWDVAVVHADDDAGWEAVLSVHHAQDA